MDIAIRQAKDAVKQIGAPVLFDVKSTDFNAFNGLPGPNFGLFHDKVGNEGIVRMLSGFDEKSAVARTVFV